MSQIGSFDGPGGLIPSPLTPEQKSRIRALAWTTVRKFVLSATGAIGVKVGEKVVEWMLGGDEPRDGDDDSEELGGAQ